MKTSPIYRRPPPGLGSAAVGAEEETLVLDALRRGELFRYYGNDPERPPPFAAQLENEAKAWIGTDYALAVSSGTAALETALAAISIGPGDEVIVPAWSWLSCVTAVVRLGALPVLAEIDDSLCLNPAEIDRLTTSRTRAVLVVHFQGVAADMDPIIKAAHRRGLFVVEDCAEAPGVFYRGRAVGTWSDVAIYSFQHNKAMTAGEGGLLVTRDLRTYERAVRMSDLGQYRPYHASVTPPQEPAFSGAQFRMSELTAAVALAQLRKVDAIRAHCRMIQDRVRQGIGELPGVTWRTIPDPQGDFGFEIYFYLDDPKVVPAFRTALDEREVHCQQRTGTYPQYRREYLLTGRAHHPAVSPFRDIKPWPAVGYRAEDFPVTEDLTQRFIALPIGWRYTTEDADHIAESVRAVHRELFT
ncbi:DegT/DnrJ/EryC1/StrS family aminotransferase [Synoicihabitans lomoniglobus]|uniref:Aminotransferase class V-fold PLP-dependent enzyme n=1 Tax=Synoicihabitans lomoniglobus TaxID=2909285 RepID=A0AAF0CRX8_9BACT|nr:aminotransferase class V-fold PLP-dependent enzyme [Opitutaceae bacterium LMO-M01]WED66984.1 aminotransferase class V-fold PLP-dependent enzyme [Opitutaceae bacterium LMO-M01]